MRRPAPLPAPAEEPEDAGAESVAARGKTEPPHRGRASGPDMAALDDASAGRGESATSGARGSDADGPEARVSGSEDSDAVVERLDAGRGENLRSADVWRAARARRKALRAEIRRFTQRSRRRRMIWWGWIGAVVALVLGSVVAAYSPLFAVQTITVAGAKSVDAAAVQRALSGQIGAPLALVDASAVKSALTEFPMIESYALEARPPHELLVRIVERTPIGVIRSEAGYTLVDAAGVVLSTTPEPPQGHPVLDVSGGVDSPAFHSAGRVVRSLPGDLRSTVTEVHAKSGDDVTLKTSDGKTIVWGSEKDSVEKSLVLVGLIKAAPTARTFDVSSPSVPVVR